MASEAKGRGFDPRQPHQSPESPTKTVVTAALTVPLRHGIACTEWPVFEGTCTTLKTLALRPLLLDARHALLQRPAVGTSKALQCDQQKNRSAKPEAGATGQIEIGADT